MRITTEKRLTYFFSSMRPEKLYIYVEVLCKIVQMPTKMTRVCSNRERSACSNNSRSMALKYPWTLLVAVLSLGISEGQTSFHSPPYSAIGSDKKPTKQQLSSIDYSLYHHSDTLLEEVRALVARHPDKIQMKLLKSTKTGYSAEIAVVTFASGQQEAEDGQKTRILLNFGQHGREMITSEVALRLLSALAGEHHLRGLHKSSLNYILQKLIIKVVPMENLNGRRIVEAGKLCERKNGRGVDINRNWSVDWGKKEKDYDPSEEYPGAAPFSEPETQIMRNLAHSFRPHLWVNVHSGMEALFMPYDHKNTTPNGATAHLMKLMLEKLNLLHCKNNCVVGSGGGSVGYLAHGTSTDYMYEIVKVPMAFTFEIYGERNASSDDCFIMFNPTDSAVFESVLENWCTAFFRVFMDLASRVHNLSTEAFGKLEGNDMSTATKHHDRYLTLSDFHTSRKVWRNGQPLITQLDKRFEWGTKEMRKISQFFFILSTFLLILLCYKVSKRFSCAQVALDFFYKSS